LESCYLPSGVQLTDISKMRGKDINECLSHWSERVEKGEIAFRFKAVEESHLRVQKSKKKRSAPDSEDEREHSSKPNDTSSSAQLKSQRTHSLPKSEDEVELSTNGDTPSAQVAPRSVDGGDSNDCADEEDTGKGKGKEKDTPPSWYDYHLSSIGTVSQLDPFLAQQMYLSRYQINSHISSACLRKRNMLSCSN
jgi:hypothetical protein